MSPVRATLFIAQGASPGLGIDTHLLSPVGAAHSQSKYPNTRAVVPLLRSSYFLPMFTQGFISGFALIPPWALKKYRASGTHDCIAQ